jgi:hypothetical protein
VFSGTYATANVVERYFQLKGTSPVLPKFLASSVVNISLSVSKDKAYARMFGKGSPRSTPLSSLSLFAIRDGMTVLASFSMPPIISSKLQASYGLSKLRADTIAQLSSPLLVQILSTPLHLLGLDLYNRRQLESNQMTERMSFIKQEYFKTLLARWSRILPAFGIGGIINTRLRSTLNDMDAKAIPSVEKDEKFKI